jgi:hypothetical protein
MYSDLKIGCYVELTRRKTIFTLQILQWIPNVIYNPSPMSSGITLPDANSRAYLLRVRCARIGYHILGNRPVTHVREMLGFMKTENECYALIWCQITH